LKYDFEGDEVVHSQNANAVNSFIIRFAGDSDLLKIRLAQKELTKALKCSRAYAADSLKQLGFVTRFLGSLIVGDLGVDHLGARRTTRYLLLPLHRQQERFYLITAQQLCLLALLS
jgi:hypothetical protein